MTHGSTRPTHPRAGTHAMSEMSAVSRPASSASRWPTMPSRCPAPTTATTFAPAAVWMRAGEPAVALVDQRPLGRREVVGQLLHHLRQHVGLLQALDLLGLELLVRQHGRDHRGEHLAPAPPPRGRPRPAERHLDVAVGEHAGDGELLRRLAWPRASPRRASPRGPSRAGAGTSASTRFASSRKPLPSRSTLPMSSSCQPASPVSERWRPASSSTQTTSGRSSATMRRTSATLSLETCAVPTSTNSRPDSAMPPHALPVAHGVTPSLASSQRASRVSGSSAAPASFASNR